MKNDIKKKTMFKFFTIPEYEEEQLWLQQQHSKGWKFVNVTFPGFYHFVECAPEEYVYQLDYNQDSMNNRGEYIQIFMDCGWEYLTDFVGYSYFRKRVSEMASGEREEIFSDNESKLEMCRRVFRGRIIPLLVIMFLVIIPVLAASYNYGHGVKNPIFIGYALIFLLYTYVFGSFGYGYAKLKKRVRK